MSNNSFIGNLKTGIYKKIGSLFYNPYRKAGISRLSIKKLKHLPPGKIRKQHMLGYAVSYTSPHELLYGIREIFIDEIYKQQLRPDSYIIDCGANIGLSIIYLKTRFPQARILAFEPDETNFKLLEENIRTFGFSDVILKKEAVWTENTTLRFSESGTMSSKIDQSGNTGLKTVRATRLKDLMNEPIDFLKLDIEGAEYAVLNDIHPVLSMVKSLFVEYHGLFSQLNELSEMLERVREQGFVYYIREAAAIYPTPFDRKKKENQEYDIQLNIYCFRPE